MHRELLEEIREKNPSEAVSKLTDIVGMLLDNIKESNEGFYEHIEKLLYEEVYGRKITRGIAEEIVCEMKPAGEHWTFEETSDVLAQSNVNIRKEDFYIVMNMAYNDFYEMFGDDLNQYITFTKLFVNDKDASDEKVYNYFMNI